jgi:predicted nucleotidyltransferase component of viral defense system
MISTDFIKKLAVKNQTTELNILREYLQHLFLSYFYQKPSSEKILFKGGTALKFIYGSPRFSEDLDFSATKISFKKIEGILLATLADIEKENLAVQVNEAKATSGGYLAIYRGKILGEEIKIQLEISLRRKKIQKEAALITQEFLPSYTLIYLSEKELVAEKIKALLERGKARDWYDLYFILRKGLEIDFKVLGIKREDLKKISLGKLKKVELSFFQKELKPLLPISHQQILRNFKKNLEREIERHI